ncbi:PREDICTED: 3-ketosteroid-9-alpha-monooxygenase oxygenase subunit [Papilio xuthus]|uniref:cholesterol 7-desaturase n=1 Tax=Papilio xuthus TaxID=66420 RepID=A0AAJ7EIT3_PAPXU|nr:PREDICTED: 3-ketosteroid-9-alpha-monooxygenase oxygenase subunit [Papilio xuthus]
MINTADNTAGEFYQDKMADGKTIPAQCHYLNMEQEVNVFTTNLAMATVRSGINLFIDNIGYLIFCGIILFLLYILYKSYFSPPIYVKELTDIGYEHISGKKDRAMNINRVQSAKQLGNKLPPPYPNGWFAVAESRDLKVGKVISVDALGLNLCVYRGEDGVARCVEAYCPHLGANLGIGGTVNGSCITCPFHQWRFNAEGQCVGIPDVETVPAGISIKKYHTTEIDGAVWVWHDAEGRDPLWIVSEAPEMKNMKFRGRNEFMINAHIQEIPENGADVAHLNALHSTSLLTEIGNRFPILHNIIGQHIWAAEWCRGEKAHEAHMVIEQKYIVMKCDVFPMKVSVTQIGPSHVRLHFESPFGSLLVAQSVTPLSALLQRVVTRVFTPKHNAIFGAFMVLAEASQFKRDVAIWNSKRYVSSPAYVRSDKTIRAFRAWYMQFYSESSVSLKQAMQNPLDW